MGDSTFQLSRLYDLHGWVIISIGLVQNGAHCLFDTIQTPLFSLVHTSTTKQVASANAVTRTDRVPLSSDGDTLAHVEAHRLR